MRRQVAGVDITEECEGRGIERTNEEYAGEENLGEGI